MVIVFLVNLLLLLGQDSSNWNTLAEASNYRKTCSYADVVAYYERMRAASPWVIVQQIGTTPEGRDMTLVVISKDKAFTPQAAVKTSKAVLLVVNGVHSGEIEGKDACMALARDICITKERQSLLDHVILVILPVFNIDGHERTSPYNRINQNGPDEMGWRCTARNLNLNRDYMKADAVEMQAFLRVFHAWRPHLWFDTHTTDGADFQYDITFGAATGPENAPSVADYVNNSLHPHLLKTLAQDGHIPMLFFEMRDRLDPSKGVDTNLGFAPRFSTGYGAIMNRPSILVETHMLKPYDARVRATYNLLKRTIELVNADPEALRSAVRHGDEYSASLARDAKKRTVLTTTQPAKDDGVPMIFRAYAVDSNRSAASGAVYPVWNHAKPIDVPSRQFSMTEVARDVTLPSSYIVPAPWTDVIERLELHGLLLERLSEPQSFDVASYRFTDVRWKERPFEGRHEVSYKVEPIRETRHFPKGSVIVKLNHPNAVVAAHLLEPEAPDSLVHWGFFDPIFEQKEYYEDYAMAPIADRMLSLNAGLKKDFDDWLKSNPNKAGNPRARLDFIHQRSPYWDHRKDVYPVGRIEQHDPQTP
ncbi:MAG: M14 family metallopeptidase [Planctomycetota bacterium]